MTNKSIRYSLALLIVLGGLAGAIYAFSASPSVIEQGGDNTTMQQQVTNADVVAVSDSTLTAEVWKSPTCGCCEGWVSYLEDHGYQVTTHDTDQMDSVKARLGLTDPSLTSCHTALIDGYVVEGHVPISDIEKLLAQRPEVVGITAPGMPMMSPGMGSLIPKDYDVISFDKDGNKSIFSQH